MSMAQLSTMTSLGSTRLRRTRSMPGRTAGGKDRPASHPSPMARRRAMATADIGGFVGGYPPHSSVGAALAARPMPAPKHRPARGRWTYPESTDATGLRSLLLRSSLVEEAVLGCRFIAAKEHLGRTYTEGMPVQCVQSCQSHGTKPYFAESTHADEPSRTPALTGSVRRHESGSTAVW